MYNHNFVEAELPTLHINDWKYEDYLQFVLFCYNLHHQMRITTGNVIELLRLADYYSIIENVLC
jgi:hypothetical protein